VYDRLPVFRSRNEAIMARGEIAQNTIIEPQAYFRRFDISMVDESENTTTVLWRHIATRTMMPTSSPARKAAARARPSKNEWIARPENAEAEVMSWLRYSRHSSQSQSVLV